ncbi:MAG: hypothetical protein QXF24_08575 [Thermoproteota archaeon]
MALRKFERIYRELLVRSLSKASLVRQEEVASRCGVSLGLVNKTVKKLEAAMAVEPTRSGVRVLSPARLLNLWATERDLRKDVWQSFRLDPVAQVEKSLPKEALVTAFSGWRAASGRMPSDYDRVYFYVTDAERFDLWLRFRKRNVRKANPNVFALRVEDEHLVRTSARGIVCVPQIYVDIYSIDGPEAAPFLLDIARQYPSLSVWRA